MQSLKSPYTLYNQQSVGSTLHNNLLFIMGALLHIAQYAPFGGRRYMDDGDCYPFHVDFPGRSLLPVYIPVRPGAAGRMGSYGD